MQANAGVGARYAALIEKLLTLSYHYFRPEAIAHGALCYSRSPIVEECVITRHLGLSYDGEYTRSGKPLKLGTWHRGIGWILREVGLQFRKKAGCRCFG